ncbi:hypothetical protein LCGC14_2577400, partial [marine sediment metagenome]
TILLKLITNQDRKNHELYKEHRCNKIKILKFCKELNAD